MSRVWDLMVMAVLGATAGFAVAGWMVDAGNWPWATVCVP